MSQTRLQQIESILSDLKAFNTEQLSPKEQYAIKENISFFQSIRSVFGYLGWLFFRAPGIDGSKLLELTDFPLPEWDMIMHENLIKVERKKVPGLISPLVDYLTRYILKSDKKIFLGVNLGSGGMEVDRQVMAHLLRKKHAGRIILVGVDKSPVTHAIARDNLNGLGASVEIREVESLDWASLENIIKEGAQQHLIVLCKNDIFKLAEYFPEHTFNIAYHSLFKHHLDDGMKSQVNDIMKIIAQHAIEYDGYRNWHVLGPQGLMAWRSPVFLNAGVFSDLRYFSKAILQKSYLPKKISFYPMLGTYLARIT